MAAGGVEEAEVGGLAEPVGTEEIPLVNASATHTAVVDPYAAAHHALAHWG